MVGGLANIFHTGRKHPLVTIVDNHWLISSNKVQWGDISCVDVILIDQWLVIDVISESPPAEKRTHPLMLAAVTVVNSQYHGLTASVALTNQLGRATACNDGLSLQVIDFRYYQQWWRSTLILGIFKTHKIATYVNICEQMPVFREHVLTAQVSSFPLKRLFAEIVLLALWLALPTEGHR